jgi:hypothetical protein
MKNIRKIQFTDIYKYTSIVYYFTLIIYLLVLGYYKTKRINLIDLIILAIVSGVSVLVTILITQI